MKASLYSKIRSVQRVVGSLTIPANARGTSTQTIAGVLPAACVCLFSCPGTGWAYGAITGCYVSAATTLTWVYRGLTANATSASPSVYIVEFAQALKTNNPLEGSAAVTRTVTAIRYPYGPIFWQGNCSGVPGVSSGAWQLTGYNQLYNSGIFNQTGSIVNPVEFGPM